MGFLDGIGEALGLGGETTEDPTIEDPTSITDTEGTTTSGTSSGKTEEQKKAEEYQAKISDGRDGYILHQGEILETHTYDKIYSASWNKDYEGISGDGSITIPFHKDDLNYIYKGVRCLLKNQRFEYDDDKIEIDDSEGYLCFITDVTINNGRELELSLSGFEKLLEQENILSFTGQRRSVILAEVIKMAGLVPVIDTEGLADEIINWSTEKENKDSSSTSGGGTSEYGESSELKDTMDTHELSVEHRGTSSMQQGYIPTDIDKKTKYLEKIGKSGTNYAEYVKDCKTICDCIKKLRAKFHYGGYSDSKWKDAEDCFDHINFINCADSAKLVKCCLDTLNFTCAITHNTQGSQGHYFNVVKKDGKWYTVDLCFRSNKGKSGSTNTLGC